MDNIGKALVMAGCALMFTLASSTSIYLYGTLNTYLDEATASTAVVFRAEGMSNEDLVNFQREITVAEIYITLFNMEQMHVETLVVDGHTVTRNDVLENTTNFTRLKNYLRTRS